MSFWWGQSPFDESIGKCLLCEIGKKKKVLTPLHKLLEQATSELLPAGQENLALNLEIADQIRGKKVNPKDAMRSLKARLGHKNPNVQLLTLSVSLCVPRHFLSPLSKPLVTCHIANLSIFCSW